MLRWLVITTALAFSTACPCSAQSSNSSASSQDPATAQPAAQNPSQDSASASQAKKPKKVWTNDNMSDASGAVSVVGDSRNSSKYQASSDQPANPQLLARIRKELAKLQSQMDNIDKQLALYKQFENGEPVSTDARQLNKGVNRVPVDQQIPALKEKKIQTQAKIDALLDEARKNGIEPGELR